jgi:hypothetical protein
VLCEPPVHARRAATDRRRRRLSRARRVRLMGAQAGRTSGPGKRASAHPSVWSAQRWILRARSGTGPRARGHES